MLCAGNAADGDDLAQEAVAKAWTARESFTPGTNLKAWTFMILRNQFYSDKRRSWRTQPLDPEVAEKTLMAVTNPDGALELDDLRRALAMLPEAQREALILVGAGGLSYEEASEILGVAVGTVKSRVSRGRDALEDILADGKLIIDGLAPTAAMASILGQFAAVSGRPSGLLVAAPANADSQATLALCWRAASQAASGKAGLTRQRHSGVDGWGGPPQHELEHRLAPPLEMGSAPVVASAARLSRSLPIGSRGRSHEYCPGTDAIES